MDPNQAMVGPGGLGVNNAIEWVDRGPAFCADLLFQNLFQTLTCRKNIKIFHLFFTLI